MIAIVHASGAFDEAGYQHVGQTLSEYLNNGDDASFWLVCEQDGQVYGVANTAAEPVTVGTWNLLMLWLADGFRGQGLGHALVTATEAEVANRSGRLLIVETSGTPDFIAATRFYEKCGFRQEARIKDFFEAGDDKLIYTKAIATKDNSD